MPRKKKEVPEKKPKDKEIEKLKKDVASATKKQQEEKKKRTYNGKANLISLADRPKEERIEIAKKGAEASKIARRKKSQHMKTFRELAKEIFTSINEDKKLAEKFEEHGMDGETNEHLGRIMLAALVGAEKGDKYDRDFVMSLVDGDKKQEINLNIGTQEDTDVLIYLPKNERDEGLDLGQTEEKPKKATARKPKKNEPNEEH